MSERDKPLYWCEPCRMMMPCVHTQPRDKPAPHKLRDESSPEGQAVWRDVDLAASRAPGWLKEHSTQPEHPFLWLERELQNRTLLGRVDTTIVMDPDFRDALLAALRGWRGSK